MDAAKTTIPPGEARVAAEARELIALRRRAYGADADIAEDAVALARLSELEGRQQAGSVAAPRAEAGAGAAAAAEPTAAEPTEVAGEDRRTSRAARWWRAAPRWALVVAGVAVGALVTSTIAAVTAGSGADATLAVRADQDTEGRQVFREYGGLDYLGVSVADLVLYDDYRGLHVWSAPSSYGTVCLIATYAGDGQRGLLGGAGCAPPGMHPIVDMQNLGDSNASELFDGLATGSVLRLTLDGDRVRVQMGAAPQGGDPVIQQP